jgi:hypothetical protein
VRHQPIGQEPRDGAHGHHRAPLPTGHHAPRHGPQAQEGAAQVDVHHAVPLRGIEIDDGAEPADAGIEHGDVEAFELVVRLLHACLHGSLVGDVTGDRADDAVHARRCQVEHGDPGAGCDETLRRGRADAARSPRHHCSTAL